MSLSYSPDSISNFWKTYHGLSKSTDSIPTSMSDGLESVTSAQEKAKMFNDFFASCFSVPDSSVCNVTPALCPSSLISPSNPLSTESKFPSSTLSDLCCDGMDVLTAIQGLKNSTATGPDHTSAVMLKYCSSSICTRLACIFNASFSSGIVPDDWKISRVTPICKKGDKSLASTTGQFPYSLLSENYRRELSMLLL